VSHSVYILKLFVDAFQNTSHIAVLQTSKEKGNGNGGRWLRTGEQRWTEPRCSTREAQEL